MVSGHPNHSRGAPKPIKEMVLAISYQVDSALGIVLECWEGDINAQDLEAHWRLLTNDSVAMACKGSLADISRCSIQFSTDELRRLIRQIVAPAIQGRAWKSAVLVAEPVQHGVARQYGALTEVQNELVIFTDPALARAWLLK
jgi:hypothetical protein